MRDNSVRKLAPTRRHLLIGAGVSVLLPSAAAGQIAIRSTQRPFSIEDFLNRCDVVSCAMSNVGGAVAFQVRRSANEGGFFSMPDWIVRSRCDLYLAEGPVSTMEKITAGPDWYSDPIFSPDGSTLAMTVVAEDGEVAIGLKRQGVDRIERVPGLRIDIASSLIWSNVSRKPIAWVGPETLIAVEKVGEYFPRTVADLRNPTRRAEAEFRSIRGGLSVRTWDSQATQTCSPGNRLVAIDCGTMQLRPLMTGDIRAVSQSPDGRFLAVVEALRRIPEVPRTRMPASIGSGGGGYEDSFVELDIRVIDMTDGAVLATSTRPQAVGKVSSDAGPIWHSDSRHFAWPMRTAYSNKFGDDAVSIWEVGDALTLTESLPARSPLDALVLAHIVAGSATREIAVRRATARPEFARDGLLYSSAGGQAAHVGETVIVSDGGSLRLLASEVGRDEVIDGHLLALTQVADETVWCILRANDADLRICIDRNGHRVERAAQSPSNSSLLGVMPCDGQQIRVDQSDQGTQIFREKESGWSPVEPGFNRQFAEVKRPREQLVRYEAYDGQKLTGVLYWPTSTSPHDGPRPVVITAYPRLRPQLNSRSNRPNADGAWMLQSLLASGFCVFYADFPVADSVDANAPFALAAATLIPALDALDRTDGVASGRYGFYGHSNGGFAGLALAAQTERFKAVVASSPFPDVFHVDIAVTPELSPLDCAPGVVQARRNALEGAHVVYSYAASPVENPTRFLENSPLYNLEHYKTPTLMLYGANDTSLVPVEKMFLALQMAGVDAELHTYWGENHVLQSPENIRHATAHVRQWFERYL